ncbi:uncharacterized protein LOC104880281 isoform X1 [Vitis vinifera]|uniref:uncharacterized protein LOC104880281 isoform X1 n=1 Tax=Vitis vinifera TaxID=29760 RepID=UPI0028833444|nr:uncharacterized protein LOC104880281 isoform X1 [Vitis vinifera]
MLCAYGGYGVTREQLQCLVGESFIDIPEICGSMSKSTSKSTLKKRLGSYCVNLECCNQFYIPLFQFNEWVIMVINLEAKRVDLLSSYNSIQRVHFVNEAFKVVGFMSQLLKNSFKRNDVNINNLHPQYADIVGDPKLCHTGMYAILYMQHWDGSGLNRTINSEVTDKLIEEDEFDADQKDAFKNFVKDNVREAKKANRQAPFINRYYGKAHEVL